MPWWCLRMLRKITNWHVSLLSLCETKDSRDIEWSQHSHCFDCLCPFSLPDDLLFPWIQEKEEMPLWCKRIMRKMTNWWLAYFFFELMWKKIFAISSTDNCWMHITQKRQKAEYYLVEDRNGCKKKKDTCHNEYDFFLLGPLCDTKEWEDGQNNSPISLPHGIQRCKRQKWCYDTKTKTGQHKVKGYNLNAQKRTVFLNKYTIKRIASSINLGKAVSDTAFLEFVKVVYPLAVIADFLNHTIINHWLNYTLEKAVSDRVILPVTPVTSWCLQTDSWDHFIGIFLSSDTFKNLNI